LLVEKESPFGFDKALEKRRTCGFKDKSRYMSLKEKFLQIRLNKMKVR
jgi:hypothetical protein